MAPISVNILKVIDLALGTTEDGIVSFNLLHSLMYLFAQRLNILDVEMEFDGTEAAIIKSLLDNRHSDFNVEIFVSDENIKKPKEKKPAPGKNSKNKQWSSITKIPKKTSKISHPTEDLNTIVEESSSITVQDLSDTEFKLLKTSMPQLLSDSSSATDSEREPDNSSVNLSNIITSSKLIHEVRSYPGARPISEMCQLLNLAARLEAAEAGINKLSKVIEDLIMEYKNVKELIGNVDRPESESSKSSTSICEQIKSLSTLSENLSDGVKSLSDEYLKFKIDCEESISKIKSNENLDIESMILSQTSKIDTNLNNQINDMYDKISDLDYRITEHVKKIGEDDMIELISKLDEVEKNYDDINDTITNINKSMRNQCNDAKLISTEIENIKTYTIDKNYLHECLREKVDNSLFQHDFNALSISVHDTHTKLENQEYVFRELFKNIEQSVSDKLDKDDILSLKIFYDDKIDELRDKIERIEIIKIETEAAITTRYIRDVNCITCGRTVIMSRMDSLPRFKIFDPIFKPFNKLTYQKEKSTDPLKNFDFKPVKNNRKLVNMKNSRIGKYDKTEDRYCKDHEPSTVKNQSSQYLMWDIQTDPHIFPNISSLVEQFTQMSSEIINTPPPDSKTITFRGINQQSTPLNSAISPKAEITIDSKSTPSAENMIDLASVNIVKSSPAKNEYVM